MSLMAQSQDQGDSTLRSSIDSVKALQEGKQLKQQADSTLQLKLPDSLNVSKKAEQALTNKETQLQDGITSRPKALQQSIQNKVDPITTKITSKVGATKDSVNAKLSKSLSIGQGEKQQKVRSKLDSAGIKVPTTDNKYLTDVRNKVRQELNLDASNGLMDNDLLDKTGGDIPETNISKLSSDLPEGAATDVLGEVKGISDGDLLQVDGLDKIDSTFVEEKGKELASNAGLETQQLDDAKKYTKEVKNLKETDLRELDTETIEKAAGEIDQLAEVGEQTAAVDKAKSELEKQQEEYKNQLEEYQSLDYIKEQVKDKQMELGVDHFAGKADKLNAAKDNLNKLKKKYGTLESTKKLPLVKHNQMRGQSLLDHLYAGLLLQLHKDPDKAVDLSPFIGYKISGVWRAGIGYTYRVRLDKNDVPTNLVSNETYGYKLFTELDVYKGIFGHVSYESMKTGIRQDFSSTDLVARAWVDELYIGGGSSFKIKKIINGYMMTLYNVNHDLLKSPSNAKIVIRVGVMFWR